MNYYSVLGIAPDATDETVRGAFRALVRQYHPDAGAESSAERFRDVVEAYQTLSDPARRRLYDDSLGPVIRRGARAPEPMVKARAEPLRTRGPLRPSHHESYAAPHRGLADSEILAELLRLLNHYDVFPVWFFRRR
jgi:curved DNA-binding protein CbpA